MIKSCILKGFGVFRGQLQQVLAVVKGVVRIFKVVFWILMSLGRNLHTPHTPSLGKEISRDNLTNQLCSL